MYVRTRVGLSACFWLWVCYSLCRVECITSSSSCYAARVQCLDTACTGQHCHTHAVAAGPRMAVVGLMFIMFTVILVLALTCHLALCKAEVIADVVLCMCARVVCVYVCMYVRTYTKQISLGRYCYRRRNWGSCYKNPATIRYKKVEMKVSNHLCMLHQ